MKRTNSISFISFVSVYSAIIVRVFLSKMISSHRREKEVAETTDLKSLCFFSRSIPRSLVLRLLVIAITYVFLLCSNQDGFWGYQNSIFIFTQPLHIIGQLLGPHSLVPITLLILFSHTHTHTHLSDSSNCFSLKQISNIWDFNKVFSLLSFSFPRYDLFMK